MLVLCTQSRPQSVTTSETIVLTSTLLPQCPDYPTMIVNGTLDKDGVPLPLDSCVPGRPSSAAQTDSTLTSWTNRIDWWGSDFDESLSCFALWMLMYGVTYTRPYHTYTRILTSEYMQRSHHLYARTSLVQSGVVGALPYMPPIRLALGLREHRRRMSSAMVSLIHSLIVSIMALWVVSSTPILWTEPMVGVTSAGRFVTVITCSYYQFDAVLEMHALLDVNQLPNARLIAAAKIEHTVYLVHHAVGILACRLVLYMNQGLFFLLGMILMEIATPFLYALNLLRWYRSNRHIIAVSGVVMCIVFMVVRPINQIAQVVWLVIIYTNRLEYVSVYWVVAWSLFMAVYLSLSLNWSYRLNSGRQMVLVDYVLEYTNTVPNAIGQEHPDNIEFTPQSPREDFTTALYGQQSPSGSESADEDVGIDCQLGGGDAGENSDVEMHLIPGKRRHVRSHGQHHRKHQHGKTVHVSTSTDTPEKYTTLLQTNQTESAFDAVPQYQTQPRSRSALSPTPPDCKAESIIVSPAHKTVLVTVLPVEPRVVPEEKETDQTDHYTESINSESDHDSI
jgi:hypothetical protein